MKLAIFFIPRIKQIYAKTLTVSKRTFKIKATRPWTLFEISFRSAVFDKQRNSNSAVFSKLQIPIRQSKPFQKALICFSTDTTINKYTKTVLAFFTASSILKCYNFRTALTKSIKLHFLETVLQPLKTGPDLLFQAVTWFTEIFSYY